MLVQNVDIILKAEIWLEEKGEMWNLELDTRKWVTHYSFNKNVNLITGPNGCGKTYALLEIQKQFKKTHKSNSYYCSILDHKWEAPYSINEKFSSGIQIAMKLKQAIDNLKKGELLLLDLPETGLHVEAQDTLVDYILKTIPKTAQVIIATHSPNIINYHIDLIAEREIMWVEDKTTKKEIKAIQEKRKKDREEQKAKEIEKAEERHKEIVETKKRMEERIEAREKSKEKAKEIEKAEERKRKKDKEIKQERKYKNRIKRGKMSI